MKKIHLTIFSVFMAITSSFGQNTEEISGSFSCKAQYPSSNQYLMDSCRVNYTFKTVMGDPAYIANVVWSRKNEFVYNGKRIVENNLHSLSGLRQKYETIAPTKAKYTFTVLFYSDKFKSYIASAKTTIEIPYLEMAGTSYSPEILTTSKWRDLFKDVIIGKQQINKIGGVIADNSFDNWCKTENIINGKLSNDPSVRGYGRSLRKIFNNTNRIDITNTDMTLEWPIESYKYIINESERINKVSNYLSKGDTVNAVNAYYSNRQSNPIIKTTSPDFWRTTVSPFDLIEKNLEEANSLYAKGDYNNASVYFQKVLSLDSTDQYSKARLAKIAIYNNYKNSRKVGDLELIYVKGNNQKQSFYIGKTEITQRQWMRVMGISPANYNECRDCPITNITWAEATEFCKKLSNQTGLKYRLPSVSEWEYAALGGNIQSNTQFAGSNNIDEVGWTVYNSEETAHQVAGKQPNEIGIYDMTGNVSEWVIDPYNKVSRITKGGTWKDDASNCAVNKNQILNIKYKSNSVGFRVCQDE